MKFITFSGVDGSGKSTQLALLKEKLERENWNVAYFHAVEFSLANRITRFFKGQKSFESGKERAITKASWFSLVVRQKFLLIDMLRFRCFLRKLKKENCDYLLSDRSFYDSIINIEYLQSMSNKQTTTNKKTTSASLFTVLCSLFIVRPDSAFYFDISPGNIMSRERVPEQGIEYLRIKQELFKRKTVNWHMTTIDASRDRDSILQEILTKI